MLTRPVRSERLTRVEYLPPYYYVHRLRIAGAANVDAELAGRLDEARETGRRRHLGDPSWPRERRPPDWAHVPREVAEAMARREDPSKVR